MDERECSHFEWHKFGLQVYERLESIFKKLLSLMCQQCFSRISFNFYVLTVA